MSRKPPTLDDIFNQEESILDRRARERRERELAHNETAEGKAELERLRERLAAMQAKLDAEPDPAETDEDENEDEDEDADD
jgi:hypothetical protein